MYYTKQQANASAEIMEIIYVTDGKYSANMTLNIFFVNDNQNAHPPVFSQTSYTIYLPNGQVDVGISVYQFQAYDLDYNLITYKLNQTGNYFSLDSFTGE